MAMKNKDFAVFILTHGRPDNVITLKTLKHQGYTGPVYFVIDNEDEAAEAYYKRFGRDKVFMFDKKGYADQVDEGNNFDERRTITHARNACFDIARQIGVTYFMQLDDDYIGFEFRINQKKQYPIGKVSVLTKLDHVFYSILKFYKKTSAKSIAMSQGGDWVGGSQSDLAQYPLKRKCMNSFICSTERPFRFVGAMNEDVNTYTTLGSRGDVFFTVFFVMLKQKPTQSQSGGITDMYLSYGTYVKSFTTVMMMPSCVRVAPMGNIHKRLHHKIKWKNCVPRIIKEEYRKTVKQS